MEHVFPVAFKFVLKYEGGYSDHPSDPGGATKLGITRAVLASWRRRSVSKSDVRGLSHDEAGRIYKAKYWIACHCGDLPAGLDLAVFDCAVNQGVRRAKRFLQQAAKVTVDGHIGPITLAAVWRKPHEELLLEFMARRMRSYGGLSQLFKVFGLGWSRRLIACHGEALRLVSKEGSKDG